METQNNNGITKSFAPIVINEDKGVYENQYKSDRKQVELKQEVTTTYPAAKVGNSKADSLFSQADFGFEKGKEFTETRVTWMEVPSTATLEQVTSMLAAFPTAMIQKHLASQPILTDEQAQAVANGVKRKDGSSVTGEEILESIEKSQRVRNSDGDLVDITGEIIEEDEDGNVAPEDKARVQYRALYFKKEQVADIDNRVKPDSERVSIANTASEALQAIREKAAAEAGK